MFGYEGYYYRIREVEFLKLSNSRIMEFSQIGGSMAERGMSLQKIAEECRAVNSKAATMGAAVTACTVPGQGPLFDIGADEIDVGVALHGEAGAVRMKVMNYVLLRLFLLHPFPSRVLGTKFSQFFLILCGPFIRICTHALVFLKQLFLVGPS